MFDPYEKKRREAREVRQRRLDGIVSPDLPVDGDPVETRKPVQPLGGIFDAVMDSINRDIYRDEARFLDMLRERWDALFPGCPARPGRFQEGRLVLYVSTSGQLFALRSRLPAMKRKILALGGAPSGRLTMLLEIHSAPTKGKA